MITYDESGLIPVSDTAIQQLVAEVAIDSQLREWSQVTSRLSVLLDINDNDELHFRYRS